VGINETEFNELAGYRSNWRIGRTQMEQAETVSQALCAASLEINV